MLSLCHQVFDNTMIMPSFRIQKGKITVYSHSDSTDRAEIYIVVAKTVSSFFL